MAHTAQRISAGRFEERVSVPENHGEITELAHTLNHAFDRYQDAIDRMKNFASNASHQLRTPLTAMRSVGEVALQKARAPEEYRETIGSMLEEVQRLAHVIEQLLLLARMESAELRRHFVDSDAAGEMTSVVALRKPIIESKGLQLDFVPRAAVSIKANPALLRQAFANLLDNAIRHTPEGGRIELAVESGNDEILVRVADTGPGIPEHFRHKLFERFSPGVSTDQQGTGLGLAIVAEVVKVHGGSLQVESVPGQGATFTMRLPAG
jgi:signal transduction histidine kinase